MVYLTRDAQIRQDNKSPIIYHFLPHIWVKLVGHTSDRVFVAPTDIGGTLLVDMRPYGCFIVSFSFPIFVCWWNLMESLMRGILFYYLNLHRNKFVKLKLNLSIGKYSTEDK